MYCTKCGNLLPDNSDFCNVCGAPVARVEPASAQSAPQTGIGRRDAESNDVILLAQSAMQGDDSVWGEIYEKTHRHVYYMVLKTLGSEQDAQDITQEVYIQAIRSIRQLQNANSFFGWLRSIVFSKCKDYVKKKRPDLLDDTDESGSLLSDIPEQNVEFLPERVLDSSETRRMVLGLVDELPYLQRQTVLLFYYDDMTVDQIAALMECASGTVKSRLGYARQHIRKGVEEFERKGVKLYAMGALPILTILLREQARRWLCFQYGLLRTVVFTRWKLVHQSKRKRNRAYQQRGYHASFFTIPTRYATQESFRHYD